MEGEGLLEVKRGASGGIVVLPQERSDVEVRAMAKTRQSELEQLYEYRQIIEAEAARLAAQRHTKAHLEKMRMSADIMKKIIVEERYSGAGLHEFMAADTTFHLTIAEAAHNDYLFKAVEQIWAARFLPVGTIFRSLERK